MPPTVLLNATNLTSQGMTADGAGNFYIATGVVGTSACGVASSGAVVFIPRALNRITCLNVGPGATGLVRSTDVAIDPHDKSILVTFFDGVVVRFPPLAENDIALAAAVLPASRSVQVGATATAFATIIVSGSTPGLACKIAPLTSIPAVFQYQTTNPGTNQLTGTVNTPVNISAGAAQSFVFALKPTAPLPPTDVQLSFSCANASPAPIVSGLNTLLLSASAAPIPDVVALGATQSNDGIVNIPGSTGTGVFAVATVNVGATGNITATADTGGVTMPVNLLLCQTNPMTGACLAAPSSSVTTTINANATPTFGIFVQGTGNVSFNPATNRIFVRFKDSGNVTRGSTSVAVRTQ